MSVSRRVFLAGSAATATAVTAGSVAACGAATSELPSNSQDTPQPLKEAVVEFDGAHQAGIDTPTQASLNLIGFNLRESVDARGVARLMRLWTADARALCAGETPLGSLEPEMNEWPANLTITLSLIHI